MTTLAGLGSGGVGGGGMGICFVFSKKPFLVHFDFQVLICSDGAPSKLATHLGIVSRPPDSTCSRAYVEAGTHKFKADGVVVYNKELLPGMYFGGWFIRERYQASIQNSLAIAHWYL